jgi:HSP20 family molecular chaperone IbpA
MSDDKQIARRETDATESLDGRKAIAPVADVLESADEYLIVADMPGVPEDAIEVRLDRGELLIEGRREPVSEGATAPVYRRTFRVPDVIDGSGVTAKLEHGVLTLHLPKAEETRPRQITVTAG